MIPLALSSSNVQEIFFYLAVHIDVFIIGILWFGVDQDNILEGTGTAIRPLLHEMVDGSNPYEVPIL